MTPKTAEAPPAPAESLELQILQDRMFNYLIEKGPKKTGELVKAAAHPAVSLHLAKYVLRTSPRFTQVERRWDIAAQWETPTAPFERIVGGFLKAAGKPLSIAYIGEQMGRIQERDPEAMIKVVDKFASESPSFVKLEGDRIALAEWLIETSYDSADDLMFYSFMESDQVEPYREAASKIDWASDPAGAAVQMVLEADTPVPLKALFFFAWETHGRDLDAERMYETLLLDEEIAITSTQMLYKRSNEKKLLDGLKKMASSIVEETDEEDEAEEAPPAITDKDVDDIVRIIEERDETTYLSDLIVQIYEIEEYEKVYEPTAAALLQRLRHDPRVMWVGADRFRRAGTIPEEVHTIAEPLAIPEYDFATPDGERFDIIMEHAGLESSLAKEVHEPLVQDVGDEDDPEIPEQRPTRADCTLKYHHKEAGTYPLAQLPDGFFNPEPSLQEITLRRDDTEWNVWVSLETRLAYGLSNIYEPCDFPISGGMFHINATDQPDEYEFECSGEVDEMAFVNPGRLLELLQLKEEADNERLPTFEVMCRLLERQSQGMSFPHLTVELNLIRRVPRMMVASILSGYACFSRQAKSGLWTFDEKKKGQGLTKSKRRYIIKES